MSFVDETAIVAAPSAQLSSYLTPQDVLGRVGLVQHVMKAVMKDNEHFGKIPGCGDKPTLLQPGAQVLAMTFQLAPDYDISRTDLGNGHREETVKCWLISAAGARVGMGIGCCSTMESKYRYRTGPVEFTGRPVPKEYWEDRDQKLIGGKGHSTKKNPDTGLWEIVLQGEKVENPDIADTYNTVLKIAKKRAFVDAVLTATAAADMFTQDLEDIAANSATYAQSAPAEPVQPAAKKKAPKNPLLKNVEVGVLRYMELTGVTKGDAVAKLNERLETPIQNVDDSKFAAKAAEMAIEAMIVDATQQEYLPHGDDYEVMTEDIEF